MAVMCQCGIQTLCVSGERAVSSDAQYEAASHREQHADVRHEIPALGVGVDQRLVDEKRVVMAHERYTQSPANTTLDHTADVRLRLVWT